MVCMWARITVQMHLIVESRSGSQIVLVWVARAHQYRYGINKLRYGWVVCHTEMVQT
jgi:hypothetical protein